MADGKTENSQGFLSNMRVIIVEHATPYGYGHSVEHLLTEVTCPAVSVNTNTKETTYHGSRRDPEHSGLHVGHASYHRKACYTTRILSQRKSSVDEGHLSVVSRH